LKNQEGEIKNMCEPTHSIIQYPPDDPDSGNPVDQKIEAAVDPKWRSWLKRVKGWFHMSKLGSGHSEAISTRGFELLPKPTFYEGYWWNRTVKLDGIFRKFEGREYDQRLALEAATDYSHRVVIGNLGMLRRFLETSMRNSEFPYRYVEEFLQRMVTSHVRDKLSKNIIKISNGTRSSRLYSLNDAIKQNLDSVIKVVLGATRQRNWLCPEWADDQLLWS
jgi:hypothetical protein